LLTVRFRKQTPWVSERAISFKFGRLLATALTLAREVVVFGIVIVGRDFKEPDGSVHHSSGGKPLILYVCGQTFNLCLTLLMAYIMFYIVFTQITESI
jgi:hypothetical protein